MKHLDNHTPTKQKLLNVLKREDYSSIKEVMEHFAISEIAVRKHLRELIGRGFVKEKVVKQEIGRPYHLYSLTSKGHGTFPNQHEQLPLELLRDLEELKGEVAVNDLLLKRKQREEVELTKRMQNVTFDQKVEQMVEYQNEKGYMIEYEKTTDGNYAIKNYNCPIYNLASSYGQICNHEKEMYRNVFTGSTVDSDACLTTGDHFCCWIIKKPDVSK